MESKDNTRTDRPVLPICLTQEQYEKIDKRAEKLGSSKASIVRMALVEYFNKHKIKME